MQTLMPTGSMCAEQDGSCMAISVAQSDSAWHASSPHLSSDPAACAGAPLHSWDTAPSPACMPLLLSTDMHPAQCTAACRYYTARPAYLRFTHPL